MHDVSDLILEAVQNSNEAGSSSIFIDALLRDGIWHIAVADDGRWSLEDGAVTTKGKGRGRGLLVIKERSISCRIERDERGTVLSFDAEDDGSLDDPEVAFMAVFLRDAEVRLQVRGSADFSVSSAELKERNAFPDGPEGIRGFRAFMESIKRRR